MRTKWQPDQPIPLPEYPRPQLRREHWKNLNGTWEYAIRPEGEGFPSEYDGTVLVPFPLESELSGVHKTLLPDETLWYRLEFTIPEAWHQQHVLIHFGAVDFACKLWINRQVIGEHKGGYLPVSFDISGALTPGANELILSVIDPSDSGLQERGKQVLHPSGIWYTAISGIWQTVWLESLPRVFIKEVISTPNIDDASIMVQVILSESVDTPAYSNEIILLDQDQIVARAACVPGAAVKLHIDKPGLWSPESPHLYDLQVILYYQQQVLDRVKSYTAMRKFSLVKDEQGCLRFALNNKPLFLFGPLDQGYFPDGLYTPPSEAAMISDIEFTKSIGCNMIRKHVKVEPARWYYHCDRLGMIVWQDMPNGGIPDRPWQATLSLALGYRRSDRVLLKRFGRRHSDNREFFKAELHQMIDHLKSFPCIAVWVPFNESWGQFHAKEMANFVRRLDPTRLVDHASGWFDQGGGDFISRHVYVKKLHTPRKNKNRAFVISEFGGYSLQIPGHLWDQEAKFGYRFYESREALTQGYLDLLNQQLIPLIPKGLAAAIYTQTTDVEIEVNGYLTYDREIEKMDMTAVRQVHARLHL